MLNQMATSFVGIGILCRNGKRLVGDDEFYLLDWHPKDGLFLPLSLNSRVPLNARKARVACILELDVKRMCLKCSVFPSTGLPLAIYTSF